MILRYTLFFYDLRNATGYAEVFIDYLGDPVSADCRPCRQGTYVKKQFLLINACATGCLFRLFLIVSNN